VLLPSCFATGVYAPVRAVARRLRSSAGGADLRTGQ